MATHRSREFNTPFGSRPKSIRAAHLICNPSEIWTPGPFDTDVLSAPVPCHLTFIRNQHDVHNVLLSVSFREHTAPQLKAKSKRKSGAIALLEGHGTFQGQRHLCISVSKRWWWCTAATLLTISPLLCHPLLSSKCNMLSPCALFRCRPKCTLPCCSSILYCLSHVMLSTSSVNPQALETMAQKGICPR